jgi:small subunit ribosomal protein S21
LTTSERGNRLHVPLLRLPALAPNPKTDNMMRPAVRGWIFLPGIRVKEGESFESALRRFKKKCEKAGILSDLRRHQHFEKPSERRKRKLNAARRKQMARRQQENL